MITTVIFFGAVWILLGAAAAAKDYRYQKEFEIALTYKWSMWWSTEEKQQLHRIGTLYRAKHGDKSLHYVLLIFGPFGFWLVDSNRKHQIEIARQENIEKAQNWLAEYESKVK